MFGWLGRLRRRAVGDRASGYTRNYTVARYFRVCANLRQNPKPPTPLPYTLNRGTTKDVAPRLWALHSPASRVGLALAMSFRFCRTAKNLHVNSSAPLIAAERPWEHGSHSLFPHSDAKRDCAPSKPTLTAHPALAWSSLEYVYIYIHTHNANRQMDRWIDGWIER